MLNDLFDTTTTKTGKQNNFLKCMVALPGVKASRGDEVLECDLQIAEEAAQLLKENQ